MLVDATPGASCVSSLLQSGPSALGILWLIRDYIVRDLIDVMADNASDRVAHAEWLILRSASAML